MDALRVDDERTKPALREAPAPADRPLTRWPQTARDYEALVDGWLEPLVRYAMRRLGDRDAAEEVVQEVFVRAFAERARLRKVRKPVSYLYRMVANACSDAARRQLREAPLEAVGDARLSDRGRSPAEAAMAAETARQAETWLRKIPSKQAEAIRLRVFDELKLHEIAALLGCSVNTVSARLRYGFRRLRGIVSRDGGYER